MERNGALVTSELLEQSLPDVVTITDFRFGEQMKCFSQFMMNFLIYNRVACYRCSCSSCLTLPSAPGLSHREKDRGKKKKDRERRDCRFEFLVAAVERSPAGEARSCWPNSVAGLFGDVSGLSPPFSHGQARAGGRANLWPTQPRTDHCSGIRSLPTAHVQNEPQGWGWRTPRVMTHQEVREPFCRHQESSMSSASVLLPQGMS